MATSDVDSAEGFPPVINDDCRVLILGSLPGERSIAVQQYYGHPRNAFWNIMSDLIGVDASQDYDSRCARLLDAGIGLWDVLASSVRRGSLDAAIDATTARPNDIADLLTTHKQVEAIAFNGRTSEKYFDRFFADIRAGTRKYALLSLPSTSPAHAAMPAGEKLRRWSVLRGYLD